MFRTKNPTSGAKRFEFLSCYIFSQYQKISHKFVVFTDQDLKSVVDMISKAWAVAYIPFFYVALACEHTKQSSYLSFLGYFPEGIYSFPDNNKLNHFSPTPPNHHKYDSIVSEGGIKS